ncbi:hypothetical protein [Streptomyces sp. LN785]|uniref:hypothetical protein n=1 Tax=Streptomyces sp. LN785 TaxID=3112983 RepID=UPI0037171241
MPDENSATPTPERLRNVKDDIRALVSQDQLATELSAALEDLFQINSHKRFRAYNGNFVGMYAKPTKTIQNSLAIDREVFILIANYPSVHARTIVICQEEIKRAQPRLQPDLAVVLHADPDGDENLRTWGREAGITVFPIYRPRVGAMPPSAVVRQRLARELFATDSFQVTGPVSDDNEFFGRREQAIELLRQLQSGRIEALFGLRKVGKTSMLNRIIDLAREAGAPKIAMVDCSLRGFNEMRAPDALKALARVSRLATQQGYAHISQTLRRTDSDLMSTFEALWESPGKQSLLIVLDEVDYITPDSPTSPHWNDDFNDFWREFRALVQESKRRDFKLSVLVSGVSSLAFRVAEIEGIENSVLHFVPEDYLSPFADGAADSMIKALGKRCGLQFPPQGRKEIAVTAAYLPYWMRMVGSYIHRHVELASRPLMLESEVIASLCQEFAETEGAEIARIALQNLQRVDPPMFDMLLRCANEGGVLARDARPLLRYGLVRQSGQLVEIQSSVVSLGIELFAARTGNNARAASSRPAGGLELEESEWAEELASINRRRNILERKAREFVRVVLKMGLPAEKSWVDAVISALPPRRKDECSGLAPDALMGKLYWLELGVIIAREWKHFERFFQDKRRLQSAFQLLNERPDAHAKDVDLADVALQRRELTWLEERIAQ